MSKSAISLVLMSGLALCGVLLPPASADALRYRALVYPDRGAPDFPVVVDDFRVNETVWDEGGVQYLRVRGTMGTFQLSFSDISQIEVVRYLGVVDIDWVRYDVRVTGASEDRVYTGTMELRVMRGLASGVPWHLYPATRPDRGALLWRIVFGEETRPPTLAPGGLPTTPEAAAPLPAPALAPAAPPEVPARPEPAAPPEPPPALSF